MRIHLVVLGLLTLATCAVADDGNSPLARSLSTVSDHVESGASGTEFWMAMPKDGNNKVTSEEARFEIHVTSNYETRVSLYYPASAPYERHLNVKPGEVAKFSSAQNHLQDEFWVTQKEGRNAQKVRKGLCIKSEYPVTVTYYSFVGESVESCRVLPYHTLGLEYRLASYYSHEEDGKPRIGGGMILATRKNTKVEIDLAGTPGSRSLDGRPANSRYTVSLDSGEVYVLATASDSSRSTDLSGSKITSDKPIAIMAFHYGTHLPLAAEVKKSSLLIEMLPPVSSWGQTHVAVNTQLPSTAEVGNHYRIMAAEDNTRYSMTQVSRFDGEVIGARNGIISKAGEWNEFGDGNPEDGGGLLTNITIWTTDKPVLLMQYGVSHSEEGVSPFMTTVPPFEQFVTGKTTFSVPEGVAQIQLLAFNPSEESPGELTTVKFDGDELGQLAPLFYGNRLNGTGIYWVNRPVVAGNVHTISSKVPYSIVMHGGAASGHYGTNMIGAAYKVDQPDNEPPVLQSTAVCSEFRFTATELKVKSVDGEIVQLDQGISNIRLLPELTDNFELRLNNPIVLEPYEGQQSVQFTVRPIDPSRDGEAVFLVEDRAGNVVVESVEYVYQPDNAIIDASLQRYDFGVIRSGLQPRKSVEIRNPSIIEPLFIEHIGFTQSNGPYFVDGDDGFQQIPPGGVLEVQIGYSPRRITAGTSNADTDTMLVRTKCREFRLTSFKGQAGLPRTAPINTIDFGTVDIGNSKCIEDVITITNIGHVPLTLKLQELADQFVNQAGAPFFLEDINGFGYGGVNPVPPGESYSLRVFCFAPTEEREYSRTFKDFHDGAGDNEFELKGQGNRVTSAEEYFDPQSNELTILNSSPHPIIEDAKVNVFAATPGTFQWRLVDLLGKEFAGGAFYVNSRGVHPLNLQLNKAPSGVYVLECAGAGQSSRRTLVVR